MNMIFNKKFQCKETAYFLRELSNITWSQRTGELEDQAISFWKILILEKSAKTTWKGPHCVVEILQWFWMHLLHEGSRWSHQHSLICNTGQHHAVVCGISQVFHWLTQVCCRTTALKAAPKSIIQNGVLSEYSESHSDLQVKIGEGGDKKKARKEVNIIQLCSYSHGR